jgi:hypothetical protein
MFKGEAAASGEMRASIVRAVSNEYTFATTSYFENCDFTKSIHTWKPVATIHEDKQELVRVVL